MKKLLVAMAMVLGSGVASAHTWSQAMFSDDGKLEIYIDVETIKPSGEIRTFWQLMNSSDPMIHSGTASYSQFVLTVVNCKTDKIGYIYAVLYSGFSKQGEVVAAFDNPLKWDPVVPGTSGSHVKNFVCSY